MNKVILMGRLCADPEVRYSQNQNQTAVARYRLAVDRRFKREGEQTADFISCVAFGKVAEFAEKYLRRRRAGVCRKQGRKRWEQWNYTAGGGFGWVYEYSR